MIIDFHNHYYPPEYLDAVKAGRSSIKLDYDAEGNPRLHYPGDYNILVPGPPRPGLSRSACWPSTASTCRWPRSPRPGVHMETPALAVELARRVNDAYGAERTRRKAFTFLATLPLNDPGGVGRRARAGDERWDCPARWCSATSTACALADARYEPLWQKADELNAVIYIHPAHPLGVEAMEQYWLMPLVGFLMDTTLAAAHLVFAGIPRRYPRITWVLCHMGGAIPYLAERLDRGYEAFADCRANIDQPPSAYLKQFYYDTVNFDPSCIELAIAFAGVDHILAGSDYPHQIGSIPKMLQALQGPGRARRVIGGR